MRDATRLLAQVKEFAEALIAERSDRQRRQHLDPADYQKLAAIGLHLAAVPVEFGGYWETTQSSVRTLCEALRILAAGDPSLARALGFLRPPWAVAQDALFALSWQS